MQKDNKHNEYTERAQQTYDAFNLSDRERLRVSVIVEKRNMIPLCKNFTKYFTESKVDFFFGMKVINIKFFSNNEKNEKHSLLEYTGSEHLEIS